MLPIPEFSVAQQAGSVETPPSAVAAEDSTASRADRRVLGAGSDRPLCSRVDVSDAAVAGGGHGARRRGVVHTIHPS